VSQLTFAQPGRRNLLAPVLLAFVILGVAIALVVRLTPSRTADLTILRTAVVPTHTVFKSDESGGTTVVGEDQAEDNLYVLITLRIEDRLDLPIFIKDLTATLTLKDGQVFTTSAAEKQDLPAIYSAFPVVTPLVSTPLLRETTITPGEHAEGMILLRFPVTKDAWERRRNAILNVDLYHQGQQTIRIGRSTESDTASGVTPDPAK
jgi:hypothetical protein